MKGYLISGVMIVLGTAGVVTIAWQASQPAAKTSPARSPEPRAPRSEKDAMDPAAAAPMAPRVTPVTSPAPDAGAPARTTPVATPDAGVPKSTPDAAAPGPPKPAGPAPVLVLEFKAGAAGRQREHRRAVRKLVDEHGYKNVKYLLTAYAAEERTARRNRRLARKRCLRVRRLIRKRGVSRRWIQCVDPVVRQGDGKPSAAHRAPDWRKVEIRVVRR